jgi:hypothetical protein
MTKEDILKAFVQDQLFIEKGYLTEEQIKKIRFHEPSPIKLIEVIKTAINDSEEGLSASITSRKINNYLND